MKWDLWNPWATVYELNSTHPLISKRLQALAKQSPSYGQEPFVLFDLVKPESYLDDFAKEVFIDFLPWVSFLIGLALFFAISAGKNYNYIGLLLVVPMAASLYKYGYTHPKKAFAPNDVRGLLGEVKVSGITSIPCEVTGKIIGRGNPGCVFNEDFVIRDESGIVLLDYDQPLFLVNKIFALFKSPQYFDKTVTARGYYRRSPVPYIQLKELVIDGEVKKCHSITFGWVWRWALFALAIVGTIFLEFIDKDKR
jgi:heat shock protein HtpX